MFNFFKKQAIVNRVNDEILYEYVLEELEGNIKKKGLWAKAYANSDGDDSKIEPLYMQYRVQAIKDVFTSLDIMYTELPRSTVFDLVKNNFENIKKPKVIQIKERWQRNDEIVTDTQKGLMWQDNVSVKELKMNWDEAYIYAGNLNLGGYTDWRLPAKEELSTIVEKNFLRNKIYSIFSNCAFYRYWSSSIHKGYAWSIYFGRGIEYCDYKSNSFYVRCVRTI